MTNLHKGIACVIAGAVIGFVASGLTHGSTKLGEVYHSVTEYFPQGISIGGPSASTIDNVQKGTCVLKNTGSFNIDASQAASSTKPYECAVTGVVAGDLVDVWLATSTTDRGAGANWSIVGATASTTPGIITVLLANFGPAAVPSATGIGSSTGYLILR